MRNSSKLKPSNQIDIWRIARIMATLQSLALLVVAAILPWHPVTAGTSDPAVCAGNRTHYGFVPNNKITICDFDAMGLSLSLDEDTEEWLRTIILVSDDWLSSTDCLPPYEESAPGTATALPVRQPLSNMACTGLRLQRDQRRRLLSRWERPPNLAGNTIATIYDCIYVCYVCIVVLTVGIFFLARVCWRLAR